MQMNKNKVKITVIIPIYNAEEYIAQCLESLMRQTYRDFELIIVNDGSTDKSAEICNRFAGQYENINVMHKHNGGLISARISGLQKASGQYIAFVDADDWVDQDFLELLVTWMESEQSDIVMMGCIKEEKNTSEKMYNRFEKGVYERENLEKNVFPQMLHFQGFYEFGILPFMWNKLYKKELLLECYDGIDTDIYDGEDAAVVFPYLLHTYRAVICDDVMYHYRIHGTSMTARKKQDYYANVAKLYLHLYKRFMQSEYQGCLLKQLDQYMRRMIWNGNPGSFIDTDENVFPFDKVFKGASIILYAAGNVGRRYHAQIQKTGYCCLMAWVDQNWEQEELQQLGVESPDVIEERDFDYVVIAVEKLETARQVKALLLAKGVVDSKII